MKKLWGVFLCGIIASACGLGVFFAVPALKVLRVNANTSIPNGLAVSYTDNGFFGDGTTKDLKTIPYGPIPYVVTFPEYEHCGSYVGVQGTFVAEVNGRTFMPVVGGESWYKVTYAESLTKMVAGEDVTDVGVSVGQNSGEKRSFSVTYSQMGVYRIWINTEFPAQIAQFDFVVKHRPPGYSAHFANSPAGDKKVLTARSNRWKKDTEIHLEFRHAWGFVAEDARIKVSDGIKGIGVNGDTAAFPSFLEYTHERPFNPQTGYEYDRFVIKRKDGAKIINGEYKITFRVVFDNSYPDMEKEGTIGTPSTSYYDVVTTIKFENAKDDSISPIWIVLLMGGILAVLGAGWYGCNWVIRNSQVRHVAKQKQKQEKRTESDRANLEKMRQENK